MKLIDFGLAAEHVEYVSTNPESMYDVESVLVNEDVAEKEEQGASVEKKRGGRQKIKSGKEEEEPEEQKKTSRKKPKTSSKCYILHSISKTLDRA